MNLNEPIQIDPAICHGKPVICLSKPSRRRRRRDTRRWDPG